MTGLVALVGNTLPDLTILAVGGLFFFLFGGAVESISNRVWLRRWRQHTAFGDKLADTAHAGLLGLAAFILALTIANGLAALARTEDTVRQEGAGDEWRRLAQTPNTLSPLVQNDLDTLRAELRTVQKGLGPADPSRADLTRWAERIESPRQTRLSDSTANIPHSFWPTLLVFVAAASFLAGRERPKRFGMPVNMLRMTAIGLAVGFVVILDNPFRGQTRIEPSIIAEAICP